MDDGKDSKQGVNVLHAGSDALHPDDPRSPENIARRKALGIIERDEKGRVLPGSRIPAGPGRPAGATITVLARTMTDEAMGLLQKAMQDEKAPMAARVTAAQAIIDRGWGKAPIQIDLNVRAKFDDFLRDVGAAAVYEHEHPLLNVVVESAIEDDGPIEGETNDE